MTVARLKSPKGIDYGHGDWIPPDELREMGEVAEAEDYEAWWRARWGRNFPDTDPKLLDLAEAELAAIDWSSLPVSVGGSKR